MSQSLEVEIEVPDYTRAGFILTHPQAPDLPISETFLAYASP
ncbi:hypothetical protein [Acaryochloris sp. IP29b_bin.137]|nr:hypothetical protein [Acaryochloris sp. IP29b_bin.137]